MARRKNFPDRIKVRRVNAMVEVERRIKTAKNQMSDAGNEDLRLEFEQRMNAADRERTTLLGLI